MKLFTIGFTKTSAENFFSRLAKAGVKRVIDVRLHNVSQLAGFAKQDDLRYFLKKLCSIDYVHRTELSPTEDMLDAYRKNGGSWDDYERRFSRLIARRQIEKTLPQRLMDEACLLCSEDQPHHCHRRIIAEYLKRRWGKLEILHL